MAHKISSPQERPDYLDTPEYWAMIRRNTAQAPPHTAEQLAIIYQVFDHAAQDRIWDKIRKVDR